MTFLPIVDRELRVAARRKSTYRIRTWTTVLALGVGFFALFGVLLGGGFGSPGKPLYTTLTTYAFGLCLLAGVLLTADCLSEEKREGTLGLLFLTDLKGYDVVLGKFMAMSLNAFYGLLAILPITGLSLLLGGLTGGEFWRMTLALINALFFSLATGICVSAFGRDAQRVMGVTLGLVLLFSGGLPVLAGFGSVLGLSSAWSGHISLAASRFEWISPYSPFACALEPAYLAQPGKYWGALLVSQICGWLLLVLASRALPHRWQERTIALEWGGILSRLTQRRRGGPAERAKARQDLLPINPVFWLIGHQPETRTIAWAIVGMWGAVVLWLGLFRPLEAPIIVSKGGVVQVFGFLLKSLFALQACRFFVEARRSGALEMLLCTPLTRRDILDGQALALKRNFLWPIVALLALQFVPGILYLIAAQAWHFPPLRRGTGVALVEMFLPGLYCVRMYADCYAIGWFGMWLALTLKKPGLAPALTILLVLILPSVLFCFDIFADLLFILWGVIKLHQQDFRVLLARRYQPALVRAPPRPTAATPGLPPVIVG